jgi:hypothetical protein
MRSFAILACAVSWIAAAGADSPAARLPDSDLRLVRGDDEEITLLWSGSCLASDDDYAVYEGHLGDFYTHEWVYCSTGGELAITFAPDPGNRYFLVVPTNGSYEGSYGEGRPPGTPACLPQWVTACPSTESLMDIDSGQTSPAGNYRWMDVADQVYSSAYQNDYNYLQAQVEVQFFSGHELFHGLLVAANLKPHFAYQLKLTGTPGTASNEAIGLTGRWWQEEWNGSAWVGGQNLNDKGDGTSPNPNDEVYFLRRDIPDPTSPTGFRYRYTGYLVFDYFITDASGSALVAFTADSSYHVLWKTSQRPHTGSDGPVRSVSFDVELPDPVSAYSTDYPAVTAHVFGEWERLPIGGVTLPPGNYEAQILLTEESFHGSGLAGGWAAAVGAPILFELVETGP